MADTNTSQTQHITSLDFDITKALQQLQELETRISNLTSQIASQNWTINAVINGDENLQSYTQELQDAQQQYSAIQTQIQQFEAEMKLLNSEYANNSNSLEALNAKSQKLNESISAQQQFVDSLKSSLESAKETYGENSEQVAQLQLKLTTAQTALQDTKNSAAETADAIENFGIKTDDATASTSSLVSALEDQLVSAFEQAVSAGYDAVNSVEDAMVEIGRVLETNSTQTESLRDSLFELGNEYGRSFEDVADVALRLAQAGYDMNDTLTSTSAILLAMNTAELDASDGTTDLIGIMNQWGMTADDLVTIIDKLNYTADNNAITTQDLADGLLKASSMAKTAGMSFDDTIGVLTAMKEASGAAGKEVGNAFKSILAYIQRDESLALFDKMGIDVYADKVTGELLPMMDILESMAEKWNESAESQNNMIDTLVASGDAAQMLSEEWAIATDSLDKYNDYMEATAEATDKANDAEARAQANAAAGVYRRNYYISLMENFANAVEISGDLVNAEGHSMEENGRYMETLTAKTEQLQTALTELAVAVSETDILGKDLIDWAKSAIESATATAQWATESHNLIPILTTILGAVTAIKSQKIASEFAGIVTSVKNALSTIASLFTGAASAGTTLVGVVGVVTAVISAVTVGINMYNKAILDAAEESREKFETQQDTLSKLKEEYLAIVDSEQSETEKTKELNDWKSTLVETYGFEYESLKNLNTEREKGIKLLDEEAEKSLGAYLGDTDNQKAYEKARKKLVYDSSDVSNGAVSMSEKGQVRESIKDMFSSFGALYSDDGYYTGAYGYKIDADNAIEESEILSEIIAKMGTITNLSEDEQSLLTYLNERLKERSKDLSDYQEAYETYLSALAQQTYNNYLDENDISKVGKDTYLQWRQGLLDAANGDEQLENALKSILSVEMPQFDEDHIQEIEQDTKAIQGMTDAEKAYYYAKKNSAKATEDASNTIKESADATDDAAASLELTDAELKELAKTISSAESNITSLNKYMETLSEGNGLTAAQVMELCDTYGLLADQFTLTENGYTIEISALEKLRDAQILTATDARLQQAGYTEDVISNILKRIQGYTDEVKSLQTVADAQLALSELYAELKTLQTTEVGSTYEASEASKRIAEIRELINETTDYADTLDYLNSLQDDLYQNLGKSYSTTSESTKAATEAASDAEKEAKAITDAIDDAFDDLIDDIKRFGDMGIYSTDEMIAMFDEIKDAGGFTEEMIELIKEKLRDTGDFTEERINQIISGLEKAGKLTEEQIQTIEDELHSLYSDEVDEALDAAEQEYKDYVQSVKDKYSADKEELEKTLDEELDLFKEQQSEELAARKEYWSDEIDNLKESLNAQISASKKAYETKKNLTTKSYDNQIDALENLRDTEIQGIKDTYNAQIDALNKIKKARQADRDEEDYQDERAEILEELSYWEQRTGTDAVEKIEELKKKLADLDKEHQRDLEDAEIDDQIDALEDERDSIVDSVTASYTAQIAALKAAKETELELYEKAYNAEQELLQAKLDKEVKAMEKARDADLAALEKQQKAELKLLEDEQDKKLQDLEDEKDKAIKAAEEKWKEIESIFTDSNKAMVASAGIYATDLYNQFHELFTEKFQVDLESLKELMSKLNDERGSWGTDSDSSSSGSSGSDSGSSSGSSSFKVQDKVKVSGTAYKDSKGKEKANDYNGTQGTINKISSGESYPYYIGSIGWVKKSQLVKAMTGGKTTADGLAMLHKNELIINPPATKKLEDLLAKFSDIPKPQVIINPQIMDRINKMAEYYNNPRSAGANYSTNSNSYSYDNSRPIVQNFYSPLQNIEKVEDAADMEAATNALERKIMRQLSTKL